MYARIGIWLTTAGRAPRLSTAVRFLSAVLAPSTRKPKLKPQHLRLEIGNWQSVCRIQLFFGRLPLQLEGALFFDCYWVGSLDFNFLVEICRCLPVNPKKVLNFLQRSPCSTKHRTHPIPGGRVNLSKPRSHFDRILKCPTYRLVQPSRIRSFGSGRSMAASATFAQRDAERSAPRQCVEHLATETRTTG